jgi:hypothetical protein
LLFFDIFLGETLGNKEIILSLKCTLPAKNSPRKKKTKTKTNKGCVTLWPCLAIHIKKYLKAKRRIMETQIFHNAKILILKKSQ